MDNIGPLLLIVGILCFILWDTARKKKKRRIEELSRKAIAIKHQIEKAKSFKTAAPQVRALNAALGILEEAQYIEDYQEVFRDYQNDKDNLTSSIKVLPVYESYNKADKFRYKGNPKSEMNCLLDAMYEIKKEDISEEDFERGQIITDLGESINMRIIQARLKELGWSDVN